MSETTMTGSAGSAIARPPLDDVMLAMDVVDTLRRRDRLVSRELDEVGREADLKQRLKRIYAQQGIDVPDHVVEQGVAALREDRFTYKPAAAGLARRLALFYVSRGRWGKWLGGGFAAAVVAASVNYFAFIAPDKALPETLSSSYEQAVALAKSDHARASLQRLHEAGVTALANEDPDQARSAVDQIDTTKAMLGLDYVIRIVNRPGQSSGVWRIPDVNEKARNYYIVVEAISSSGENLSVVVENEETGETESVDIWGLRVDEATFNAVKRDKQDDGIIERDRFGAKQRGYLLPRYDFPTSGGAITRW